MTYVTSIGKRATLAIIPGGAVGAHSVPGNIAAGDSLIAVIHFTPDLLTRADLTAEFSVTAGASNSITNTTTDTTGNYLAVVWMKPD